MDNINLFAIYLSSKNNNSSRATIKNYRADISQFTRWYENRFKNIFQPTNTTREIIEAYKKEASLSPRSIERHLSSLRKFFHFLKIEGVISKSPFESIENSLKNKTNDKDKWYLKQFKNYLYVYNSAHLTIKNYIIDVRQFLTWTEQVMQIDNAWDIREKNIFHRINSPLINEYKQRLLDQNFSPKTINRKLSSLRKYLAWGKNEGLIKSSEFAVYNLHDSDKNKVFQNKFDLQDQTTKYKEQAYQIKPYPYSKFPPLRLYQKTANGIILIFDNLLVFPLATVIDQGKYIFWRLNGKPVFKKTPDIKGPISNFKSAKEQTLDRITNYSKAMFAPLSISTTYFPLHKKLWHHARHTRPKWYSKYHYYTIVHYLHFAVLVVFMSAIGFSLYNKLIFQPQNKSVLSSTDISQPRTLVFKGRLTDSSNNPITSPNTLIRTAIYNHPSNFGQALLWEEVITVNPDSNGIFQATLGKNEPIPQEIFTQNNSLWLGISVGDKEELTPRQELASVSYAANSQTIQGLPPITENGAGQKNVILALNSSGNLTIGGSATPVFEATSGQFTLSGKVLVLTTVHGTNADVAISPDGFGRIDLHKPLQNTSNNNNIESALGAVEIDDLVAILATSSGQSALTVNQDSTGPIISASASGTAKFTVDNIGNIISANAANWQPTFDSLHALNIASASGHPFITFDTLNLSVGIGTVVPEKTLDVFGSFRTTGDVTFSKFTSNGGILYATSSGGLAQVAAGTSTQCLLGGTTPKFTTCPANENNFLSVSNGSVFPNSSTADLLVGGQSTASAKFAFINVASGTPTASISGNIVLDSTGNIQTTKLQTLTIGGTTTGAIALSSSSSTPSVFLSTNGNVGIGTSLPLFKLDIQDSQSATAAGQIFNTNNSTDADGLIVKLGNTSTSEVNNGNHFISFETSGIGIVGSVKGNGAKGVVYETSGIADFAEYLKKDENQTIEYGSVLCINEKGLVVPCDKDNTNIVGVASEHPAFLGGENLGNKSVAVGLAGQVYARVSNLNGDIKAGDPLTYSSIPGVVVKQTKAGHIVGKALEPCGLTKFSDEATPRTANSLTDDELLVKWQNGVDSEGIEPSRPTFLRSAPKPSEPTPSILCEKVLTLVNISWHDPNAYLASTGKLELVKTQNNLNTGKNISPYELKNPFGKTFDQIGTFTEALIANLQAGFIKAEEITTNSLTVATESVTIAGKNLKDYVTEIASNVTIEQLNNRTIISPIAEIDQIHTNIISPLGESLIVRLTTPSAEIHDSSFIIQNSSASAVAIIDSLGNASFSGILSSQSLNVNNDATIAGTLRANNILANSIEGLEARVSTLTANYIQNTQNTLSTTASENQNVRSSDPSADGLISPTASVSPSFLNFPNGNLTVPFATFTQGLMSFGPTSLAETSVAGPLYIQGSLILANNSINVLGNNLEFQSLRLGGISFLSGLIEIDRDGNLKVKGNAEFAKDVSIKGDLVASGSGTFSKINLALVEPALAVSQTEIVATGSAGIAQITSYNTEVTIKNNLVTDKSLIYITPVGTPSAQAPFLMRQISNESFTVGVESPTKNPIPFNWLIVN